MDVQLKRTMSFCWATTLSGEKTAPGLSVVLPPTVMTIVSAHAEAIRAKNWTINYQHTGLGGFHRTYKKKQGTHG